MQLPWQNLRQRAVPVHGERGWDANRLAAAHSGPEPPFILDVRTEGEFRQGHIPGARLLPLARLAFGLASLPRERIIVCVCRSGHRSDIAAARLRAAGFDAVSLQGGMLGWKGPVQYVVQ